MPKPRANQKFDSWSDFRFPFQTFRKAKKSAPLPIGSAAGFATITNGYFFRSWPVMSTVVKKVTLHRFSGMLSKYPLRYLSKFLVPA